MLNFVSIPTETLKRLRGKPFASHLLMFMSSIRNVRTNNTRFISKPVLADITGISTRHVYDITSQLESMGLIECLTERRGEYMWHLPFLAKAHENQSNVKQFMTDEEIEADTQRMLKEMYSNG